MTDQIMIASRKNRLMAPFCAQTCCARQEPVWGKPAETGEGVKSWCGSSLLIIMALLLVLNYEV